MGRAPARPLGRRALGVVGGAALLVSVLIAPTATAVTATVESATGLPAQGTVFAVDPLNQRVLAVAPDGTEANVMTGVFAQGVAVDRAGDVFATDYLRGQVVERTRDGTQTTVATGFVGPQGIAVDDAGDLFVTSGGGSNGTPYVTEVSPSGHQTRLSFSGLVSPQSVAVDDEGDVFVTDRSGSLSGTVWELTPAGQQTVLGEGWNAPWQVAVDRAGNVFVADGGSHVGPTEIHPDGTQTVLPGMANPSGVSVDPAGNAYVSATAGLFRVTPGGTVTQQHTGAVGSPIAAFGWTPQQVSFTSQPDSPTVGDTYQATATGGDSDQPVVFSATPASTGCTVTPGGLVIYTHVTTCVVAADQAAGGDYSAAPQTTQTIEVQGAPQTVTFTSTPHSPRAGDTYQATATGGGSGQPVVFSAGPSSTGCTVTADGLVRMTHAQPCVIAADQKAGGDYAAAPRAVQAFAVSAGVQTITYTSQPPVTVKVGDTYRVSATGGGSGQPVTFSADASSTGCTVTRSGFVTMTHAGQCAVAADQTGDADYAAAAESDQRLSVDPGDQHIRFTSLPSDPAVGASYDVTASGGGSDEPVVFSTDPSSTGCSVTPGGSVSLNHVGQCVIAADQPGDDDYDAAPQALQSFGVSRAGQTISFTSGPARWVVGRSYRVTAVGGGSGQPVVFSTAPASRGCTVTPEGVVTATHARTCVIAADQAGDDDFGAAHEALQTHDVARGGQAVRITSTAPRHPRSGRTYRVTVTGGASGHPIRIAVRGACSVHRSLVTFGHRGRCTITATQQGSPDWLRGSATQAIKGIR